MSKSGAAAAAQRGTRSLEDWLDETRPNRLDLSGADLSNCKLRWMNFAGANLQNVNFSSADLTGAYFGPASFSPHHPYVSSRNVSVNIEHANFSGAFLLAATFNYPRIAESNFAEAYLGLTNFRSVIFDKNNFYRATFLNTGFFSCKLDGLEGLETIQHLGPSHIDLETLMRSGSLSNEFLRRLGVTREAISRLGAASLASMRPSKFVSCFISHSTSDREFCDLLYARMRKADLRVWYAPEDMRGGRKILPQISKAIGAHDKVVLILSPNSMKSNWVVNEIKWSLQNKDSRDNLFPICIADTSTLFKWELIDPESGSNFADEVRKYFIPDFSRWRDPDAFEASFQRLLRDLSPSED